LFGVEKQYWARQKSCVEGVKAEVVVLIKSMTICIQVEMERDFLKIQVWDWETEWSSLNCRGEEYEQDFCHLKNGINSDNYLPLASTKSSVWFYEFSR
jgi:hypothetical protein